MYMEFITFISIFILCIIIQPEQYMITLIL